jgi:hypothetical protein
MEQFKQHFQQFGFGQIVHHRDLAIGIKIWSSMPIIYRNTLLINDRNQAYPSKLPGA